MSKERSSICEVFTFVLLQTLISCISYAEGIEILFHTNKFHIGGDVLMRHLPLLILPQRLERITSLELVWDLHLYTPRPASTKAVRDEWKAYDVLLQNVASAFPKLEKLYLSMEFPWYQDDAREDEVFEQRLLSPIDELVRLLGMQLGTFHIMLSYRVHRPMMERAEKAGTRTDHSFRDGLHGKQAFWRSAVVPKAPDSESQIGYWVKQGRDDNPIFQTGCFGTCI